MDLKLKGKAALVAASSDGIGKACARQLADEGCSVVCCARDSDKLETTVARNRHDTHPNVIGVVADVTDPKAVTELIHKTLEAFGSIDILINNAGGPPTGLFVNLTDEDWEKAYYLTLMSTVRLSREVIPYMSERNWGRIINIRHYRE